MSSIGKNINAVFPELSRARPLVVGESADGRPKTEIVHESKPGTKSISQALDLNGDNKADLFLDRTIDTTTGLFRDTFTVKNDLRVNHDMVIFHTDEQGIIRHETHFDDAKPGKPSRQVNLGDGNGDGKIDHKSVSDESGQVIWMDSNRDGIIDLEIRHPKQQGLGPRLWGGSEKTIPAPFFVDEP